jgi:hypothetical protein
MIEDRFYPNDIRSPLSDQESPKVRPMGGTLAFGSYDCTEDTYTGVNGNYTRTSQNRGILLLSSGRYTFRGTTGTYVYDPASGVIRWSTGYLTASPNVSTYRRNERTSQIDIAFKTNLGTLNWSCGTNLR